MYRSTAFLVSKDVNPVKTYTLNKDMMVMGRTLECEIPILSINVSRQHAILKRDLNDVWTIEDNKSLNGVYVNNQQLPSRIQHTLVDGDFISMGPPDCSKHKFLFTQLAEQPTTTWGEGAGFSGLVDPSVLDSAAPGSSAVVADDILIERDIRLAAAQVEAEPSSHLPPLEAPSLMDGFSSNDLDEADEVIRGLSESILQNLVKFPPDMAATQATSARREDVAMEVEKAASKARDEALTDVGNVMENEFTCAICTELFVHATTLNCSHTFCRWCIFQWKKSKKECPICRHSISTEAHSLVLDNFIDKMVLSLSEETKRHREELVKERTEKEKEEMKPPGIKHNKQKLFILQDILEDTDLSDEEDGDDSSFDFDDEDDDDEEVDGYFTIRGFPACLTCGSLRGHRHNICPLIRYR